MISIWFYCTDVHFNDWLLWGWWAGPNPPAEGFIFYGFVGLGAGLNRRLRRLSESNYSVAVKISFIILFY